MMMRKLCLAQDLYKSFNNLRQLKIYSIKLLRV